jgi:alpha,alpha-trehalose phosphorylase
MYRTAEEYMVDAIAVDMADTAGNLRDGVHVASAGGAWMATVYGFAGYRWRTRGPEFAPILPTRVRRVRFPLALHGSTLEVDVEEDQVTYRLKSGEPVTAHHYGHAFTVTTDEPVIFPGQYRTSDAAPTPDVPDAETIGPTEGHTEDQPCTAST